jgi:PPOX class probable F420-dependent enzyme
MTSSGHDPAMPKPGRPLRPGEFAFVRDARVGRLATVDAWNRPSVVPFCFALLDGDEPIVVSALDEKPKRVAADRLARVRNILANPEVSFVVDRYEEDWSHLVFVQVRGRARLLPADTDGHQEAVAALRAKYPQYASMAIERRTLIVIEGLRGASWRGDGEPVA